MGYLKLFFILFLVVFLLMLCVESCGYRFLLGKGKILKVFLVDCINYCVINV